MRGWVKGIDYPHYMGESALVTLNSDYLSEGDSPKDAIKKIARRVEIELGIDGLADRVFYHVWEGNIGLSSPIWSNFGKIRGLPISCFNSHISDSILEFMNKSKEIAIMSKNGGGTSAFFGDIRPRGYKISNTSAKSNGVMSPIKIVNNVVEEVSQGGTRRGMLAGYLDFSHKDVIDFLDIRKAGHSVQTITTGIVISDKDVNDIINEDPTALTTWAKIQECRSSLGVPYIMFSGNCQNHVSTPIPYRQGNILKSSNLCLTGDTKVNISLYEDGRNSFDINMNDLDLCINTSVYENVYVKSNDLNGNIVFSEITASSLTGHHNELIKIKTQLGNTIKCTLEHKIYTQNRGYVMAKDLLESDKLEILDNQQSNNTFKIKTSILKNKVPVYDITVKYTSNFYANGILVHNCSEIILPSNKDESFVCCLASMNLATYDEWKTSDAIEVCVMLLEAVMNEFIRKAQNLEGMEAPLAFAKRHRALGIGTLGEHTYFQEKKIPFTSILANSHRTIIYKDIFEKAKLASIKLSNMFGPCDVNKEFGINMRHTTLMAIAPTTTNALICGDVSPGIEPLISNVFQRKVAKGSFTKKNPTLEKVLEVEYERNDADTWDSIISNFGSVQHLEWMSDDDKEVFKTAFEINQYGLIQAASIRQKFIDQSQSLNLFVLPNVSAKDRSRLCLTAYMYGIKTLYYQRSLSSLQEGKSQEQISNYFYSTSANAFDSSCTSCEG